jgi:hypothetical protein
MNEHRKCLSNSITIQSTFQNNIERVVWKAVCELFLMSVTLGVLVLGKRTNKKCLGANVVRKIFGKDRQS